MNVQKILKLKLTALRTHEQKAGDKFDQTLTAARSRGGTLASTWTCIRLFL